LSIQKFTVVITTRNRISQLSETLETLDKFKGLRVIICDDGSTDKTREFIFNKYPNFKLIYNSKSKGYIYSRNRLMNMVETDYAISLDDDSQFLSPPDFNEIHSYFSCNSRCAVLALRIYWGINSPQNILNHQQPHRVKSFVGCGHICRMSVWNQIPNYPEWFKFYGEEDFAAFHLFKRGLEVHYYPDILIHHRVDIAARKKNKDYIQRTRRSLRSGWYLYLMFYPKRLILKRLTYSLWMQLKNKVFKGDLTVMIGMTLALLDLLLHGYCLYKNSSRLDSAEFRTFSSLADTKIYWTLRN
jgi:glycosyltransferase involved in cell wall biosynthesis